VITKFYERTFKKAKEMAYNKFSSQMSIRLLQTHVDMRSMSFVGSNKLEECKDKKGEIAWT
jgi:hypothetical protein